MFTSEGDWNKYRITIIECGHFSASDKSRLAYTIHCKNTEQAVWIIQYTQPSDMIKKKQLAGMLLFRFRSIKKLIKRGSCTELNIHQVSWSCIREWCRLEFDFSLKTKRQTEQKNIVQLLKLAEVYLISWRRSYYQTGNAIKIWCALIRLYAILCIIRAELFNVTQRYLLLNQR